MALRDSVVQLSHVERLVKTASETALAAIMVWIFMWALAFAIAGACTGCAVTHARPPVDAGCVQIITCLSGAPPIGDCTAVCANQVEGGDR